MQTVTIKLRIVNRMVSKGLFAHLAGSRKGSLRISSGPTRPPFSSFVFAVRVFSTTFHTTSQRCAAMRSSENIIATAPSRTRGVVAFGLVTATAAAADTSVGLSTIIAASSRSRPGTQTVAKSPIGRKSFGHFGGPRFSHGGRFGSHLHCFCHNCCCCILCRVLLQDDSCITLNTKPTRQC